MVKRPVILEQDSIWHKILSSVIQLGIWGAVASSLYYAWKYPQAIQKIFPGLELPNINLSNILQALVFMSLVLYVFRFFKKMIIRWVNKHPKEDKGVYYSLISNQRVALYLWFKNLSAILKMLSASLRFSLLGKSLM